MDGAGLFVTFLFWYVPHTLPIELCSFCASVLSVLFYEALFGIKCLVSDHSTFSWFYAKVCIVQMTNCNYLLLMEILIIFNIYEHTFININGTNLVVVCT